MGIWKKFTLRFQKMPSKIIEKTKEIEFVGHKTHFFRLRRL